VGKTLMVVQGGTEKERVCSVDLAADGEAVGEAPTLTRWRSGRRARRRSGRVVWTLRRSVRQSARCQRCRHGGGQGAGPWVAGK
jgi:hypothetical protein